jgi:hypothetical protein
LATKREFAHFLEVTIVRQEYDRVGQRGVRFGQDAHESVGEHGLASAVANEDGRPGEQRRRHRRYGQTRNVSRQRVQCEQGTQKALVSAVGGCPPVAAPTAVNGLVGDERSQCRAVQGREDGVERVSDHRGAERQERC